MSLFDVSQALKAYQSWEKSLASGDVKGQERAEFFLNRLSHREGITGLQLLTIVQSETGVAIN